MGEAALDAEPNIEWLIGRAGRILVEHGRVIGLTFEDGDAYACDALVVTTGTFLNGLCTSAPSSDQAGRVGEPPSRGSRRIAEVVGFEWGRLKTGTPPRLDRDEHRFRALVATVRFTRRARRRAAGCRSHFCPADRRPQIDCHLLHTNDRVRDLVRANIARSPLFNGQIHGIGPRYCPSLEDKIVRFPDKERHQIFLEPEGVDARRFTSTASRCRCRATFRRSSCTPCPDWRMRCCSGQAMRSNTISSSRRSSRGGWKRTRRRPFSRRAD